MSWDWDKLKKNQDKLKDKKPEGSPNKIIKEDIPRILMIALACGLLLFGVVLLLTLTSTPINTGARSLIEGIIGTHTDIIKELAIANQGNQRTHEILERYGLRLGENNELYVEDSEKLRQRRSTYDH